MIQQDDNTAAPAPPVPPAAPPVSPKAVASALGELLRALLEQELTLEFAEADDLHLLASNVIDRIEGMPHMLLRAALAQVEGEGMMMSEGAILATQALDAAYPEWEGVFEAVLDDQFEREDAAHAAKE